MTEHGGNCWFGAIRLMWRHKTLRVRAKWLHYVVPHFFVGAADGSWWHFKRARDVFPPPFCYLWFKGRFEQLSPKVAAKIFHGPL